MTNVRIIPRLDIKGPNLVKGIHLEGLRVLGNPQDFAKLYYESGADELFFQDTVASLYDRNSLTDIISKTAEEIFIPLTIGGGIRTIDDITKILRAGGDKVSINTAAIKNPNFITEAAMRFGSSTIVVAIEAIKHSDGNYFAFTDNGREESGVEVFEWAEKVQELGAGEIVITSVDREGTGEGFDLDLIRKISENSKIPVIAHGGVKNPQNVLDLIQEAKVDGIAIAASLHYNAIRDKAIAYKDENASEGNFSFLQSGSVPKNIETFNLRELKYFLSQNNVSLRTLND